MPRTTRIPGDDELAEVLSPRNLELPERPRVADVKAEEYQDSTGEDSLQVYVVLDEATGEQERGWRQLKPIYEAIYAALQRAGDSRYPYITAGTPSEYARRYAFDPDADE